MPIPDGSSVTIEHVAVGNSKETLGFHTCPTGGNNGALKAMQDKAPARLVQLEYCLQKHYWQIMPLGGIICLTPKVIRKFDKGLYSAGCPHLGVEILVEQLKNC